MTTSQSIAATSRGVRLYKLVILGDGGVGKSGLYTDFGEMNDHNCTVSLFCNLNLTAGDRRKRKNNIQIQLPVAQTI